MTCPLCDWRDIDSPACKECWKRNAEYLKLARSEKCPKVRESK
jgi:hypothetical protein